MSSSLALRLLSEMFQVQEPIYGENSEFFLKSQKLYRRPEPKWGRAQDFSSPNAFM